MESVPCGTSRKLYDIAHECVRYVGERWPIFATKMTHYMKQIGPPSLGVRFRRLLLPPKPFVMNPREMIEAPLGRWNLYIGGAGSFVEGYINLDLFPVSGVDVVADAHHLPFGGGQFQRVECDAVLEHVKRPDAVMREIERVLAPGGFAHVVVPFCHPFHEYPKDFHRFSLDGLMELAGDMEIVASGWRTGPTATILVFVLEYAKLLFPWRSWRVLAHGVLGWMLFPLRYLDYLFFNGANVSRIGNHCYVWVRKSGPQNSK